MAESHNNKLIVPLVLGVLATGGIGSYSAVNSAASQEDIKELRERLEQEFQLSIAIAEERVDALEQRLTAVIEADNEFIMQTGELVTELRGRIVELEKDNAAMKVEIRNLKERNSTS
jgi:predicted RNase H-related nuclease YkuK (DUF458 family)